MFLLDTNVVSHATKMKQNEVIRRWFSRQDAIAIPFPVFIEIHRGIVTVGKTHPVRAEELAAWIKQILLTDFHYPEMTVEVARTLGEMYCCGPLKNLWYTRKGSSNAPGQDLFIAAISIVHGLPIATLDWKDFQLIDRYFPLPGIYNPAFNTWSSRFNPHHQLVFPEMAASPTV